MRYLATLFLILFIPSIASAAIRINEIAWMGISGESGQFGEWLELYNDGAETDLAGWKIYTSGGTDLLFTLTKSISDGGYLIIERTTASMTDPLPAVNDESGTFGSGGLSNDGEHLVLKDANGNLIQSLNFTSGWPAGNPASKETMQWNGADWITAEPTPKAPTGNTAPLEDEEENEEEITEVVSESKSKGSTPKTVNPYIKIILPENIYSHIQNKYHAEIQLKEGTRHPTRGIYRWNFGDGTAFEQTDKINPIFHTYKYPGRYTIWFGYYPSIFSEEPELSDTETITVSVPEISVDVVDGSAIVITNETDEIVDLSDWIISSAGMTARIPKMTILSEGGKIHIPSTVLGLTLGRNAKILMPDGTEAAKPFIPITKTYSVPETETVKGEEISLLDNQEIFAEPLKKTQKQNHTKKILFGVVATIIIGLFVLLERFMARQE